MGRKLGVAISGGGHRATLWGLGSLLYLVDKQVNREVSTITSVSGGSIANGVVGQRVDFANTNPDEFRTEVRPLVRHIADDGLFFYGSQTNGYLARVLTLVALSVAGLVVVLGIPLARGVRYLLDTVGLVASDPLDTITLWPVGAALIVGFGLMTFGAWKYSKIWNPLVTGIGVIGIAIGAGLWIWDVAATPAEWDRLPFLVGAAVVTTVLLALAVTSFAKRSERAEAAMNRAYFNDAPLSDMGAKSTKTTHIVCASELQSGIHTFFSGDFVYSYQFGLTTSTSGVDLATAVQASAALPGAFGPRRIETANMGFVSPTQTDHRTAGMAPLLLTDGGVYDNMGDQWFVRLADRRNSWTAGYKDLIPDVDDLILVNASTGWQWKPFGRKGGSNLTREATALGRVISLLYNTVGRRRRAHLGDIWNWEREKAASEQSAPTTRGAFVEVNDDPLRIARDGLIDRLNEIAPSEGWPTLVKRSESYPTVLRQIPEPTATQIMWHAYIVTALRADRWLGIKAEPADLLDYEEFHSELLGERM